jgi:hypothetical protein
MLMDWESSKLRKVMKYKTRGQEIPQQSMYRHSCRAFGACPWDQDVENTWALPQLQKYQDFQIISFWIKGILPSH